MSFDRIAPHYRWMELVLAGRALQRCRTAFLETIPSPHHALLLGEGNGRFLIELIRTHPNATVTCLDASAVMLDRARRRATAYGLPASRIHFVHTDIMKWEPTSKQFDLIVSHFFLDCFREEDLAGIAAKISHSGTEHAHWLLADFCEAPAGLAKWRSRLILSLMYSFFRHVTQLPAKKLTPPDVFLQGNGFTLRERRFAECRLLHTDLWTRA